MRIVLISDTHGLHDRVPQLPQGDILLHAGDFMNAGYDLREVVSFNRWLGEQPFAHRIVCGGNHDRLFENSPELARSLLSNGILVRRCHAQWDETARVLLPLDRNRCMRTSAARGG